MLLFLLSGLVAAVDPTATIARPDATLIGTASSSVETFQSIPLAQPPIGPLRLRPPQPFNSSLGTVQAKEAAPACPQFIFDRDGDLPSSILGLLTDSPLFQVASNQNEDCLYINVYRPAGTTSSDSLPVLFWIFGGGFELGWASMYDGTGFVEASVDQDEPIIFVTVAYRVGGFGFLPGKEVKADGSANLGLLDQRLGLQWVADNIASFGGDPDKVTIWGESAGAISVFDHCVAYDGDNTYNGKPLFRAGIMNSGSVIPADPVDGAKGQVVYDTVTKSAGCDTAADSLACLRALPFPAFLAAANSVPALFSYSSLALSYLPRPDGAFLTASPDILLARGSIPQIPLIIGDQEDEGTLFALAQPNITTTSQLAAYLLADYFPAANASTVAALVALYADTYQYGSPFRSFDPLDNWYPQFKRLAAILGDLTFTLARRRVLAAAATLGLHTWSYLSSYGHGTPVLGTFHGSDLLQLFAGPSGEGLPGFAAAAFRAYYVSFANHLDPNRGVNGTFPDWPEWVGGGQVLNVKAGDAVLLEDDFRQDVVDFLGKSGAQFDIKR